MSKFVYECVYTDKIYQKRNKRWRDGLFIVTPGQHLVELKDENERPLASKKMQFCGNIQEGEELIFAEAFEVQVGTLKAQQRVHILDNSSPHQMGNPGLPLTKKPRFSAKQGMRPKISRRMPRKTPSILHNQEKVNESLKEQGRPVVNQYESEPPQPQFSKEPFKQQKDATPAQPMHFNTHGYENYQQHKVQPSAIQAQPPTQGVQDVNQQVLEMLKEERKKREELEALLKQLTGFQQPGTTTTPGKCPTTLPEDQTPWNHKKTGTKDNKENRAPNLPFTKAKEESNAFKGLQLSPLGNRRRNHSQNISVSVSRAKMESQHHPKHVLENKMDSDESTQEQDIDVAPLGSHDSTAHFPQDGCIVNSLKRGRDTLSPVPRTISPESPDDLPASALTARKKVKSFVSPKFNSQPHENSSMTTNRAQNIRQPCTKPAVSLVVKEQVDVKEMDGTQEVDIANSQVSSTSIPTESASNPDVSSNSSLTRFTQMSSSLSRQKKKRGFRVPQQKEEAGGQDQDSHAFGGPIPMQFLSKALDTREGVKSFMPSRNVGLPNSYPTLGKYCTSFLTAIGEELQLQVSGIAEKYVKAVAAVPKQEGSMQTNNKFRRKQAEVKDDAWWFFHFKRNGVNFYPSVKLIGAQTQKEKDKKYRERRRDHGSFCLNSDSDEEKEDDASEERRYYLKISNFQKMKEKSTDYSKGDIWCLSTTGKFMYDKKRNPTEELYFVRSLWHGPSPKDGMVMVSLISGPSKILQKDASFNCTAKAIRCFSDMTFFSFAELIHKQVLFDTDGNRVVEKGLKLLPLMDTIMHGKLQPVKSNSETKEGGEKQQKDLQEKKMMRRLGAPLTMKPKVKFDKFKVMLFPEELKQILDQTTQDFSLNAQQAKVLEQCIRWFKPRNQQAADSTPTVDPASEPIILVHGVFGAGKSFTLVALCTLVDRILRNDQQNRAKNKLPLRKEGQDIRILMSGATNMSVDRVLRGLQMENFESIARIGALPKINRHLLPHVVHQSAGKSGIDYAKKHLDELLKESTNDSDSFPILQAIEELKSPQFAKLQNKRLRQARVTGVTCASCTNSIFSGCIYDIVILDECSQMIEPLSLLPIVSAQASKAVLVGDPMQLPPPLAFSKKDINSAKQQCSWDDSGVKLTNEDSLEKTLFVRLSKVGFKPVLLGKQYRCHPDISKVANVLFYSGRLTNGISGHQRPPIIPGLPPISFVNAEEGQEARGVANSFVNEVEGQIVIDLVQEFLNHGIDPHRIGVISLYKGQGWLIRQKLNLLNGSSSLKPNKGKKNTGDDEEIENDGNSVQVSTVDAFQGAEKDIIIVSCCRTEKLGFITSPHRLNVTITRAKNHLIIIGRYDSVTKNHLWKSIADQAEKRGKIVKEATELFA